MAKRIVDEEMRFTVVINGNEAQKELYELEKSTRELSASNRDLRAEKVKLGKEGKKGTDEYKALTAQIDKQSTAIKENKTRMFALQKEIGVTGLTMNQLRQRAAILGTQLRNMVPGSAQYKQIQLDLSAVTARMRELQIAARGTAGGIGRLADGFNRYFALGASVVATGTGMVLSIQKIIDYNSELSDSQADVRKTTGLTKKEVDELTKSFGLMKTRTARVELLKIAEQAGRLGITGVKNLQDFVVAANEIKVALGDDLSEEAIQEIGKLTNIYKVGEQTGKDFAGAMTAVGSAINEVSASGANQAGYLVDYLKRQSGIAAQAKISADQNIGYAATFDEIGQSVEVSATAMNKVWMDLFKDTATYAKIAGMSVKDFSSLLETDANEAMLRFLEGLNGNNEGLSVMVEKLEDIDVGGARGAQALSALAGSTVLLRARQELANKSLQEATSVTEEYRLKNENLAATIDKVKKTMIGWFASENIINGLDGFITWFAKFIGATEDAEGGVAKFRNALIFLLKLIIVVTAAMVTNVAWLKLTSLWTATAAKNSWLYTAAQKAHVIATEAAFAASQLYAAATMLLSGNIRGATQAMRVMSATLKTTPWGMVLGLVSAIATAYILFSKNVSAAEQAQKNFNEVQKVAAQNTVREKVALENLLRVAQDDTLSKEKRLEAIKKINAISPEYLGNLNLENINTQEATKSINKYIEALDRKALAQALESKQVDLQKKMVEEQLKGLEEYKGTMESLGDNTVGKAFDLIFGETESLNLKSKEDLEKYISGLNLSEASADAMRKAYEPYFAKKEKALEKIKDEIDNLNNLFGDKIKAGEVDLDTGVIDPTTTPTVSPTGKDTEKVDLAKKQAEELLKIQDENLKLRASLITNSFDREMQIEEINHSQRIAKLRSQMASVAELKGADPKTRTILIQKNQALNDLIESEDLAHQQRLGSILQRGVQEDIKIYQEKFEREKTQRETAHNLELAALGNNEIARQALQDKFNQEETDREAKHLQDLIAKMNAIIASGNFEGFNLELLSEDEKKVLLDFLDQANLKFSALLNKSSEVKGKDKEKDTNSLAGGVDILGFTVDQWKSTFDNLDTAEQKILAAEMAIGAMMNAWGMYNDFVTAKQQVELQQFERAQDAKQRTLERQLNAGYINQRQYNRSVEELEKETQRKRAEMEYKTAKRNKEMAIANIVMNTALGIAKTLGEAGFFGIPLAAIVGALGAVQLGVALATPLPAKGYEEGLYPVRREQDGQMFNAGYGGETRSGLVKKPTLFLAGEKNKPEMIIDNKAWRKMDPDVKNSLYRELSRVKGFESGYYPTQPKASGERGSSSSVEEDGTLVLVLNRAVDVLDKLEKNGVMAVMSGSLENAKMIQDKIDDYNKLRNANKR